MTVLFTPTAPLPIYASDIMLAANQRQSILRNTVTTKGIDQGSSFTFEVADSGFTYAKERAPNGNIPVGNFSQSQITADIVQKWSKVEKSFEELKGSQGDIKRVMVEHCAGEIARTEDKIILDELESSSTAFDASAVTLTSSILLEIQGQLLKNKFKFDNNIYAVLGYSAFVQLNKDQDFKNSLIAGNTPLKNLDMKWDDSYRVYNFLGINIIVHPNVPGTDGSTQTNFLYHKTAIGSVMCMDNSMDVSNGIVPGEAKQFCLAGIRTASKALQTTGLFKFYTTIA